MHQTEDDTPNKLLNKLSFPANIAAQTALPNVQTLGLETSGSRDNFTLPLLDSEGLINTSSKQDKASGSRGPTSAEDFGEPELVDNLRHPLANSLEINCVGTIGTPFVENNGSRDNIILPHPDFDRTKKTSQQDKVSDSRGPTSAENFAGPEPVDNLRRSLANSFGTVSEGVKALHCKENNGSHDNIILPQDDEQTNKENASSSRSTTSARASCESDRLDNPQRLLAPRQETVPPAQLQFDNPIPPEARSDAQKYDQWKYRTDNAAIPAAGPSFL